MSLKSYLQLWNNKFAKSEKNNAFNIFLPIINNPDEKQKYISDMIIESFFGRFKDVLRSHYRYWECDDLQKVIDEAVHYFNYIKPLRKLKRKPPVQYRLEQAA